VIDDPTVASLTLRGDGRAFSSGGDLDEFGSTPDPATAHAIRTLRSPALLVHRLRELTTAHLHGACIGAGIEVPAAAQHVIAREDCSFRLPEIGMGLIPGAGGTVTIPRRIGRHRTLHWALSDRTLDVRIAKEWGLIDGVGAAS
jgi:enoyl-CoA hydratase/carnithine racemase